LLLSACGGGSRQDANEPSGNFPVNVSIAKFPTSQRLSEHSDLVITIRNAGSKTIPNIAVTLLNPKNGTSAQAFAQNIGGAAARTSFASLSRPIWIIDRPPGPCQYSCQQGGPGAGATAYSNTWALGRLKPGASTTFDWGVTAVKAGSYVIRYSVAAGLNGKARAVDAQGRPPTGTFAVTVHSAPNQAYVNNQGQIVTSP
jgi:hypothetical protein